MRRATSSMIVALSLLAVGTATAQPGCQGTPEGCDDTGPIQAPPSPHYGIAGLVRHWKAYPAAPNTYYASAVVPGIGRDQKGAFGPDSSWVNFEFPGTLIIQPPGWHIVNYIIGTANGSNCAIQMDDKSFSHHLTTLLPAQQLQGGLGVMPYMAIQTSTKNNSDGLSFRVSSWNDMPECTTAWIVVGH